MSKRRTKKTPDSQIKRYIGLHLGGSKSDKTCMAILEFYPMHKKVFLSRLHSQIGPEKDQSSDSKLHHLLTVSEAPVSSLAIDAPLSWPKCIRCNIPCPGYENCTEPEIKWMWRWHKKRGKSKKPNKIFSPYTQRCSELFLAQEMEKAFFPGDALGANQAPLLARAHFLLRRLKVDAIEVFPPLSLWRIGHALGISKGTLSFVKHSAEGEENRLTILKKFVDSGLLFIYEQDLRTMAQQADAFDALICGLTAYLSDQDQCEPRPAGFPKSETWISVPKPDINFVGLR